MTTTVPAIGGPAQAIRQDASGLSQGGPAWPVYGFPNAAAAAAAGYTCEGGPAMSVYVVSAAQLASGRFYLEGDRAAIVLYTAPANSMVEGSFAQPVYLVGGDLSAGGALSALLMESSGYILLEDGSKILMEA